MGFTNDLRSVSAGRAAWFVQDQTFEKLPNELQTEIIGRIRKRKGLPPEIPKPQVD
jgi:elongation factor 2